MLIAVIAGFAASVLARRYPDPSAMAPEVRGRLSKRRDPETATGLALTLALVLIFGGGILFAVLAVVVRDSHALSGIDSGVADWGDRHASGFSTSGLKLVTDLGETWMAVIVGVVVALVDARVTRNRWVALFLVVVVAGDKFLTSGLKTLVDRVRPDLNPVALTLGPSFPSGHTSTAAALWAAVALVACRWWGRRAIPPIAGLAVGIAVAVAASRVLLDVHWLTDVIAGLALGWAWFATCAVAFGGRVLRFGATAEEAQKPPRSTRGRGAAAAPAPRP